MNNLEIEFPRLIQFEKTFHKTTAILLLLYGIVSMYYIYDFSVSIYELLYLSCDGIQNGISLISDALFWVASFILYWAIKQLSLKRFKKYFYTMGSLITIRLGYAFTIMVDDHSCKVTIRQKIVGIAFYLIENLFYMGSMATAFYARNILQTIKDQKSLVCIDIKDSLII